MTCSPLQHVSSVAMGVLLVTLFVLDAGRAHAQGFEVSATNPPDGSVSVPLDATITFNFTRGVDLSNDWGRVLLFEPRDAITPKLLTIGDINTRQTNVISYEVEHMPDTDFIWLIFGMRSAGRIIIEPFVLRYTTALEHGTNTVAGFVSSDALDKRSRTPLWQPRVLWRQPRHPARSRTVTAAGASGTTMPSTLWQEQHPAMQGPVRADGLPPIRSLRKAAVQVTPENTLIFLADRNIFEDDNWTMRGAGVAVDASGAYTIPYVRDGVYWPVAVKDLDEEGTPFEALGFYDPDGDEKPDSVVVNGEGVISGVDIALFDFAPVTAVDDLTLAFDYANQFADDQELRTISGVSLEADGKSLDWRYSFYSPANNLLTRVFINGFFVEGDTSEAPGFIADMLPLPDTIIDSDVAKQTADQNGGLDFLSQHSRDPITLTMLGGNMFWRAPRSPNDLFWDVQYGAFTDSGFVEISVFVDMETGAVLEPMPTAIESDPTVARGLALRPNYPNPFKRATTIPFALSQATHVRLTVYNVLGREVATLVDEIRPAGQHIVAWRPKDLPSGLYFYRLQTADAMQSGTMLLKK